MAAYVIAEINVTDSEAYEAYRQKVGATIEQYGGRYLVRGGEVEALEGETVGRIVVLEFPDGDALRTWYRSPEYSEIKALRHAASTGRVIAAAGV